MRRRGLSTGLLVGSVVWAGAATSTARAESAEPRTGLSFPDGQRHLTEDEAAAVGDLRARGCRVMTLSPPERAALERAAVHVHAALADPLVQAALVDEVELRLEVEGQWLVRDTGQEALDALRALPSVSVMSYDDGADGGGCSDVGHSAMNAVAWIGLPVVLVYRPHLAPLAAAADDPAATRALARTLAHELAHVAGYTHPDDDDAPSAVYQHTVPAVVGRLAERFREGLTQQTRPAQAQSAGRPGP